MTDRGTVYSACIDAELKAERERRVACDSRGQNLVTSSGALVTLFGGLAVLVKTGTVVKFPAFVVILVCAALVLLAGAATCGIVASWSRLYAVTASSTLRAMVADHWDDSEVDARNNVSRLNVNTVRTLRSGNTFKARWVGVGLVVQVLALVTLGASVVVVIANL